jgi:hypothetical protein
MLSNEWLKRSFVIFGVICIAVVSQFTQSANADGKFFPEKALKVAPNIPSQRAILVYKGGIEKLTIESALEGKGREFGWIIPSPSTPTEFKEVSPGLVHTFSLAIQPKIVHDLRSEISSLWRIALLITFLTLILVGTKSMTRILSLISLLIISSVFFMPHLGVHFGGTAFSTSPGVRISDIKEIGSYDLAVLEADSSGALDIWLHDNGFTGLTEADQSIVSDYIKNRWCFVAAKLRRENDGYSKPHPLSMSFAADTPVYPVRLTGTTGGNVYLELFVIAGKRAVCKQLALDISDTYHLLKKKVQLVYQGGPLPGFFGKTYRQEIGHPDACEQMWDGCVLSRFSGVLTPELMSEDISLQLQTKGPFQKLWYSHRGARGKALISCLIFWCILPIVLSLAFIKSGKKIEKGVFFKRVIIPILLLSLLIYGITYFVLPKRDVISTGGKVTSHWISDYIERKHRVLEIEILAKEHDDFAGMSKNEIDKLLSDYFISKKTVNAFTGEPIKKEDSPGNYTLIEDDRGIVWRVYTLEGYPDDCVLVPTVQD